LAALLFFYTKTLRKGEGTPYQKKGTSQEQKLRGSSKGRREKKKA